MIRRLRQRHQWLIIAVALATALLVAWALRGARLAEPPSRQAAESRP